MSFSFVIFCIQICLIQYAFTQRVNGPGITNNGLQYGSNAGLNPGQALGRMGPELGGVIGSPGIGTKGPNQGLGPYGQVMPNSQTFGNAGMVNSYGNAAVANQGFASAGMPNQPFGKTGLPNQAFGNPGMAKQAFPGAGMAQVYGPAGMANQVYASTGMPNQAYAGAGIPNQAYTPAGIPNPAYGGSGNGDVAVTGELPVAGMTSVTGKVPLTGKVAFNGNVPCGGIVTITGTCSSCGGNVPYGQVPTFGNKAFGY